MTDSREIWTITNYKQKRAASLRSLFNALDPIGATPLQDDTGKVGEPAEPTIQFTSASSVNLLIVALVRPMGLSADSLRLGHGEMQALRRDTRLASLFHTPFRRR